MTIVEVAPGFVLHSDYVHLVHDFHVSLHHERRVATPEGADLYGQPIGTIITKDMLNPFVKSFGDMGTKMGPGSRVRFVAKNGKTHYYTKQPNGQWKNEASGVLGEPSAFATAIKNKQLTVDHVSGEKIGKEVPAGATKPGAPAAVDTAVSAPAPVTPDAAPTAAQSPAQTAPAAVPGFPDVPPTDGAATPPPLTADELDNAVEGSTFKVTTNYGTSAIFTKEADGWTREDGGVKGIKGSSFQTYLDQGAISEFTPKKDAFAEQAIAPDGGEPKPLNKGPVNSVAELKSAPHGHSIKSPQTGTVFTKNKDKWTSSNTGNEFTSADFQSAVDNKKLEHHKTAGEAKLEADKAKAAEQGAKDAGKPADSKPPTTLDAAKAPAAGTPQVDETPLPEPIKIPGDDFSDVTKPQAPKPDQQQSSDIPTPAEKLKAIKIPGDDFSDVTKTVDVSKPVEPKKPRKKNEDQKAALIAGKPVSVIPDQPPKVDYPVSSVKQLNDALPGTKFSLESLSGGPLYVYVKNADDTWMLEGDIGKYPSDEFKTDLSRMTWHTLPTLEPVHDDSVAEPQIPADLTYEGKVGDQPTVASQLDALPVGSEITHKSYSDLGYAKTDTGWIDTETFGPQTFSSDMIEGDLKYEAGMTITKIGDGSSAPKTKIRPPEVTKTGVISNKKTLDFNGEQIKIDRNAVVFKMVGKPTESIYVKDSNGWTIYSKAAVQQEGASSVIEHVIPADKSEYFEDMVDSNQLYTGDSPIDPHSEAKIAQIESDLASQNATAPLVPNAVSGIQFSFKGYNHTVVPGTKFYKISDNGQLFGKKLDGSWTTWTDNAAPNDLSLNSGIQNLLNKKLDGGSLTDVTSEYDKSAVEALHPSGLKPGKYSKGPHAKVYMLVSADGSAVYVDKSGAAKKLSTKAVLANHAAGMQHYHGPVTGALPIPGQVQAQPVQFSVQGNVVEAPAGSKIYHLSGLPSDVVKTKWVLAPNGTMYTAGVTNDFTLNEISDQDIITTRKNQIDSGDLVEDTTATQLVSPKATAEKKAKAVKKGKLTSGVNPFDFAPLNDSSSTSKLKVDISKLAEQAGYKNIAGAYRTEMTNDQKTAWINAWYTGDFEKAYEIELVASLKNNDDAKITNVEELDAMPVGSRILYTHYSTTNMYKKREDGIWELQGSSGSYGIKKEAESKNFEGGITYGRLKSVGKASHKSALKHPGSPDNPDNADGIKKLTFDALVPGEIPAGTKIETPAGQEALFQKLEGDSYYWGPEEVDAYLLAAGMVNSQGMYKNEKKTWVAAHRKGNKIYVDRISLSAKNNVDAGNFYSAEITPPKPVVPAGQVVPGFEDNNTFNIGASHANNLTDDQINAYLSHLFTNKALGSVKKQPLDVRRAMVQLHWLSTQPSMKGALKTPGVATFDFTELANSIEGQISNKHTNYEGMVTDHSLDVPNFDEVKVWKKAAIPGNFDGEHSKYFIVDDAGNQLFFKPAKNEWLVQAADGANKIGRFFGFKTNQSELITTEDGTLGQGIVLTEGGGHLRELGLTPEKLTEGQFIDVMREHVLDWAMNQDDSHAGQFILAKSGNIVGIDKDRAFANFGKLKLERGQLSDRASVYYEDMYKAVVNGKIDPATVQKAYKAVMARARVMQSKSDGDYGNLLKYSLEKNPKFDAKQREALIGKIIDRKNNLEADFQKFWDDLFAEAGIEKPGPTSLSEAPGVHAGFTPEHIEDVKKSRNWGHAAFFDSQDLEDGHILTWEEKNADGDGSLNLNGQALLLKSGDNKFSQWLSANYKGPDTVGDGNVDKTLFNKSDYDNAILNGIKTIRHHLTDGQFNQSKITTMQNTLTSINYSLEDSKYKELYPDQPKKQEAHKEMLDQYKAVIENAFAKKEKLEKPGIFTPYNYVWQKEASPVDQAPSPGFKITKRQAQLYNAKLDDKTNQLTALKDGESYVAPGNYHVSGSASTEGQPGQEYVITLDNGTEIIYRPWKDTSRLSQEGQLRFRVDKYGGDPEAGSKVINFLRDQIGIEAGQATDESFELQYWRTIYGIMEHRSDRHSGNQLKVQQAVALHDPRQMNDPQAELARWREVWGDYAGQEVVDRFVESQGFLPKFDKVNPHDPDNGHGRPYWNKFDVDLSQFRYGRKLLVRSQKELHGSSDSDSDDKMMIALMSGGVAPVEERARLTGFWKPGKAGGSGDSDSAKGSGSFTMARQNIDNSTNYYHFYFDPEILTRIHTYAWNDDHYGEISYKPNYASFDINQQTKHNSSSNEVVVKGHMSMLSSLRLATFLSETKRQKAIDFYNNLGIYEINGAPLEEVFVLTQDRKEGVKRAKDRIKAEISGTGFAPLASKIATTPVEFDMGKGATGLDSYPEGTVVALDHTDGQKLKKTNGVWVSTQSEPAKISWNSSELFASANPIWVLPKTSVAAPVAHTSMSVKELAALDIHSGAQVQIKDEDTGNFGSVWTLGADEYDNQQWTNEGNTDTMSYADMETYAGWGQLYKVASSDISTASGVTTTGSINSEQEVYNAPVGAKIKKTFENGVNDFVILEKQNTDSNSTKSWKITESNSPGFGVGEVWGNHAAAYGVNKDNSSTIKLEWVGQPQTSVAPVTHGKFTVGDTMNSSTELDELPQGTVMNLGNYSSPETAYVKVANNKWQTQADFNSDSEKTYVSADFGFETGAGEWKITKLPDAQPIFEDLGPSVGDTVLSPEKMDSYPIGAMIGIDTISDSSKWLTKQEDQKWASPDGNKLDSSFFGPTLKGGQWVIKSLTGSDTAKPESPSWSLTSLESLDSAPVGTKIKSGFGTIYTKQLNTTWQNELSGTEYIPEQFPDDIAQVYEVVSVPTAKTTVGGPKSGKVVSIAELNMVPTGTYIRRTNDNGVVITLQKIGSVNWEVVGLENPQGLDIAAYIGAFYTVHDALITNTAVLGGTAKLEFFDWVKEQQAKFKKGDAISNYTKLNELPLGSVIKAFTPSGQPISMWTKIAGYTWSSPSGLESAPGDLNFETAMWQVYEVGDGTV